MKSAAALLLLVGCSLQDPLDEAFGPDGRTIREEIASFPQDKRDAFAVVQRRCTRCHTLNNVFASHLPRGGWRSQVRTMALKPGAAIPDEDAERIQDFLEYFYDRRRAN